jgi:adenylosuccinate lyase
MHNPYERLKDITKGAIVERDTLRTFIGGLDLPADEKQRMLALEPKDYIGNAAQMAMSIRKYI